MESTRFLLFALQESVNFIRDNEEKRNYLHIKISDFLYDKSLSIFNTPGNTEKQSEIMCYMYSFVCHSRNYINICHGDENLSPEIQINNLRNMASIMANHMIEYYLENDFPAGGALGPQNDEEREMFEYFDVVLNNVVN